MVTVTIPSNTDFVVLTTVAHKKLLDESKKASEWEAKYRKLARNLQAIRFARQAIISELDSEAKPVR